jgi:hypothetical protein
MATKTQLPEPDWRNKIPFCWVDCKHRIDGEDNKVHCDLVNRNVTAICEPQMEEIPERPK